MMDLISAERRRLADLLAGLSPAQWQAPSLCDGWTVAHVVAHLTMPFRISEHEFAAGMARASGDFTTFSDEVARRDSTIPPAELITALRDNADNPWSPPGGGQAGALSHDVIHGLDITWPLSVDHPIADPAMRTVLSLIVGDGEHSVFGFPLEGIRLQASDLDWSSGSGEALVGRGSDVLLLIAGRPIPAERFAGQAVRRLSVWAR